MANDALHRFIQHLHRAADVEGPGRPTDAELLERFAVARDQAAFEVLVWRHGPLVLNLCRRLLRHEQDAEDAFQATFLTLVRKAGSIAKREAVAGWLYKVAYRVALEANARTRQRAERETAGVEALAARPDPDPTEGELQLVLGEEVNRLPERYRLPLVLHCFEGKSSVEVAQQLGCAEATVRTRLARARQRLHTSLARRGLLSAGLLASGAATRAVPAALVDATVKAATPFAAGKAAAARVVSVHAVALAERVLKLMFLSKLKQVAAIVLVAGVFSTGAGLSIHRVLAGKLPIQDPENKPKPVAKAASQPKDDRTEIRGTWVTWETVTRSINGKTLPPQREKRTWVITEDKIMQVGADGFLDQEDAYKLDPNPRPKAIDLTSPRFGTYLGIYELQGDTLKICYGEKRPTEFPADDRMLVFKRVSRAFDPVAQRFANAPGCFWIDQPRNPSPFLALGGDGINYFYDVDRFGAVILTMSYLTPGPESREYRPVLLDAAGRRYLPKHIDGGYAGGRRGEAIVTLYRWRMDPNVLSADRVDKIGVEALTPASRLHAAREALGRARSAKIEVLPWPQAGEAYPFTLTAIDGRKIRSEELKGKVVLIDCWATSCSPCMALMRELKTLYERWHQHGLEIIGINFDRDVETAQKACKSDGLTWPQIHVPDDERIRGLWQEAGGIGSIPRMLVIDQHGILQADSTEKLEERIANLLGARAKPPGEQKR
jgi:RNA polymerase sigma factor (sigma-70 family)